LQELKRLGYRLIVVTNQPDVARGTQTREAVETMHAALAAALPVDEFLVCYHDDQDGCTCRKPLPGMLLQAAQGGVELAASFLVGDRWRDMDAGCAAGVRTIFIDHGYRERQPATAPDVRVTSLAEAAEWIRLQSGMV
jgi:D-glycero-D-manno-heptose 1,7-bisphosphate phosphatase